MPFWNEISNRVGYLMRRSRFDREFEDEIQSHLQARAAELEESGLSPDEAMCQARREFGSTLHTRENARSAWQVRWLEDLASDLRYAARALRRTPALSLAAMASLALAIGASTTIFSVAREALFSQPSCRDPKTLVRVSVGGGSWIPVNQYRYLEQSHAFAGLAGVNIGMVVNWRDANRTWRLAGTRITANFFAVTGIPVALGRPIAAGESRVAVVTHAFWTNRLAADPNVLGRQLVLDGEPFTVVGVLPRDHRMLAGYGFSPDLYLVKDPVEVMVYARLPEGLGSQAAYARLQPVCRELDRIYPDPHRKWARELTLTAVSGAERLGAEGRAVLPVIAFFGMLVIVSAIVVLIACANVSSLLLARAFSRSRELAIRMSLGGTRGRLIRQLLAEGMLLACLGTGAGLLLDVWLSTLLNGVRIPTPLPIQLSIQPDWVLLAYSAALALAVTLATGLVPAFKGASLGAALNQGGRQSGPTRWTLRNVLAAGQLAVSILLLSAAFLFLRSLLQASSFSAGFDTTRTIAATVQTAWGSYTPERFAALVDAGLERLRALPGVEASAPATIVPLNPFLAFSPGAGVFRPDGGREFRVQYNSNAVGPDYFRVMRIPILQGRPFLDTDRPSTPDVVILNENLARRLFGSVSPVGHTIRSSQNRDLRIVGVARNSKYVTLGEENAMALYAPYAQQRRNGFVHFFVRTTAAPETVLRQVNDTLSALDPMAAVEARPLSQHFAAALMPSRVAAAILGGMALFGLLLASIGLYGVLLYGIQQRVREIGIRVALGATPRGVLALVAGESSRLIAAGMATGLGIAVVAVRPLARFLVPEVRPADPVNFVVVACVLALVGALATVAPTIRALRVDPAVSLRHE